jgi:hypothetical protein
MKSLISTKLFLICSFNFKNSYSDDLIIMSILSFKLSKFSHFSLLFSILFLVSILIIFAINPSYVSNFFSIDITDIKLSFSFILNKLSSRMSFFKSEFNLLISYISSFFEKNCIPWFLKYFIIESIFWKSAISKPSSILLISSRNTFK